MKIALPLALSVAILPASPGAAQETFAATPTPRAVHRAAGFDIQVLGDLKGFDVVLTPRKVEEGLEIVTVKLTRTPAEVPPKITLRWSIPSHDVAGHWVTGHGLNKSIRPDWVGSRLQSSMFARQAPVSALFGTQDQNVLTFAFSDALNTVTMGSGVREEDGLIYNDVILFGERHESVTEYTGELRLDRRRIPYWTALEEVATWWAAQPGYAPAEVPDLARQPMYSTWYNYHQNLDASVLLKEVAIAKKLGMESIIVDDGWQTLDSGRGYAYTGDWEPERLRDMKGFVEGCHKEGVNVLLWYAVPFVGKHAKIVDRFKDKSLRYEERIGAYVLDPRYPEVRQYLIDIYTRALKEWDLDGFKLDFIERFTADEKTVLEARDGRDFASVNEATDRLMTDILAALKKIKPGVMVEYRQPYIGPLIRKYGNMFRAGDCPNSAQLNRQRTTDLRLLTGNTAVHADMTMWHYDERVESAALQLNNTLFSVPQISVRLADLPKDHFAMVQFYTSYWNANRTILLDGEFEALDPAASYPVIRARKPEKEIVGVYGDAVVRVGAATPGKLDLVNGKASTSIVVASSENLGSYRYTVRDCQGRQVRTGTLALTKGAHVVDVPASGIVALERAR